VPDLISGQLSVPREAFERLGGFDIAFSRSCEDLDFGYRARRAGLRIVFNPDAISQQHYEIDAHEYTRRSRDSASASQVLAALYPEIAGELWQPRLDTIPAKLTLGPLSILPRPLSTPVRSVAEWSFSRPEPGSLSNRLFFAVQTMERIRGAREGRRAVRAPIAVVLAYHSIANLAGDRILGEYGVPPARFARQLDRLIRDGWQFVTIDQLMAALAGAHPLPERAMLLTFDDAYVDLLTEACPILAQRGVPAVVFVVGDLIGGTNDWRRSEARALPLLDADGLRRVSAQGVAVQSHGATHRPLVELSEEEVERELTGSAERIASLGFPRPTAFSYPHGEWTPKVATAVERAGYQAAFTVTPGAVRRFQDRYALPRIEVLASDTERSLARRLARVAGPGGWRLPRDGALR
jgi:peptidoglycan/xylan/chitin deacetylase (PgdA/CDA1 family)